MWVEVVERVDGRYRGLLRNDPAYIETIDEGDLLDFGPEHVVTVTQRWPLLEKKVLVTRRSEEDDIRPGWVYREEPDNDIDSGWRALIGDETDAEMDSADKVLAQNVGYLLDRWPELEPVLRTDPDNGWWRWDETANAYVPG